MSDRFTNKNKEYIEDIDGVKFTLKALHWGDRGRLAAIMRQLYQPLFEANDILQNDKLSDQEKKELIAKQSREDTRDYLNPSQIKVTDEILQKYIVSIKGVKIPIEEIQFKEADVLAIMSKLLSISNMTEKEAKNSKSSSSSK